MVEVKLNVCFWNTFIYYVWLLRVLWNDLKFSRITIITFGWQLFAYFYQISIKCYCLIFLIELFTWTIISSVSQKYKTIRNLKFHKKRSLNQPWMNKTILAYYLWIEMVSHSSLTNHEFLTLVIRGTNVSFLIESVVTYEKGLIMMLYMKRIFLLLKF